MRKIYIILLLTVVATLAKAQVTIGGGVYGGGKQGAVGTGYATDGITKDTDSTDVTLRGNAPQDVATVKIQGGVAVKTVFGGGENGRAYGSTSVEVTGKSTQIGQTSGGGLFGGGDGASAHVFGNATVTIRSGQFLQRVYGGGNKAALMGSTTVHLLGGNVKNSVFGGAREANIFGHTFVHVDGANMEDHIVVNAVYGGNDVSGVIAPSENENWPWTLASAQTTPAELKPSDFGLATDTTRRWKAHVLTTKERTPATEDEAPLHILIGQLFGGGDGAYDYKEGEQRPNLDSAYIELDGGSIAYVYGGGNEATVTGVTDICINNTSDVTTSIKDDVWADAEQDEDNDKEVLTTARMNSMGINTVYTDVTSDSYQFSRVFGGNNKQDMDIQPQWHLKQGKIRDLYSGGNAGDMTCPRGILLAVTGKDMFIHNVFGGSRLAEVHPKDADGNDVDIEPETYTVDGEEYTFPDDHSARLLITGGQIDNVYGGNDISGNTKGGNALYIHSSIIGDVYGGGNGSYAYTDNEHLKDDPRYGDFYYNPGGNSLEALFEHRPHAEQVYIYLKGTEEEPTYIGGSVYCGGNSATLDIDVDETDKKVTLKMGSYVIANNMFMGSNGENMVKTDVLKVYDGTYEEKDFSTVNLRDAAQFADYMKSVSVKIKPMISFDENYVDNSSRVGSFFCGGNMGSMTGDGAYSFDFDKKLIIFTKMVAGCNNANIDSIAFGTTAEDSVFVDYKGGLTGAPDATTGNKVEFDVKNMLLEPKKLIVGKGADGKATYTFEWDTQTYKDRVQQEDNTWVDEQVTRLVGGNLYGGCYNSGYVNGNVEITLSAKTADATEIFDNEEVKALGVSEWDQSQDIFCNTLTLYGGGYGPRSVIRGNVTFNVEEGAEALQLFGGGQMGVVEGNTTINFNGGNVDEVYGGGFQGEVKGNSTVWFKSGTAYDVFGGACNADIGGSTRIVLGRDAAGHYGVPEAKNVYGGNDFGGTVKQAARYKGYKDMDVYANASVEYYHGKIDTICGGNYGMYEYAEKYIKNTDLNVTEASLPHADSAFVKICTPNDVLAANDTVKFFLGGSEGCSGEKTNDGMQTKSYVLVDAPGLNMPYTSVFGAGAHAGLGIPGTREEQNEIFAEDEQQGRSDVWLVDGTLYNAYGTSLNEGYTFRSYIHVPEGSTVRLNAIFAGGKGSDTAIPCDTRRGQIDYESSTAQVNEAVYGGNDSYRRVLESYVNVSVPVKDFDENPVDVYGAGYGPDTWASYTYVQLKDGARVRNAFGGGRDGMVMNQSAEEKALDEFEGKTGTPTRYTTAWPKRDGVPNTQVYIAPGATVEENVYGGGLGEKATVRGTASVLLDGGEVQKVIYGGGYGGDVTDSTFVNIPGGTATLVYGGGLNGAVGVQDASPSEGATQIIIGTRANETTFASGQPAIKRSVYGGGENGAVYGSTNVVLNNGYVGYSYDANQGYQPVEIETNGNLYGAGKGATAVVTDSSYVCMYGGTIRNSLYGGGEIAPVGVGTLNEARTAATITHAAKTKVEMWGGLVEQNIFGGGRGVGYDNNDHEMANEDEIYGFIFGNTDVNIYHGTVGTPVTLAQNQGNVFGGGNVGYVYSAGMKEGNKDDGDRGGFYYKGGELTEDSRVVVKAYGIAKEAVTVNGKSYEAGDFIPNEDLNMLTNSDIEEWNKIDQSGIRIYNAVFAGGNASDLGDRTFAFATTIYGNATASVVDVYCRDLISIGGDGVGGLYGDGNYTYVDGYRELNITNYGTDYYRLQTNMGLEEWSTLTQRERELYVTRYKNKETDEVILTDEYNTLSDSDKEKWEPSQSVINQGRYINTVQRCDLAGIVGSRLVLRGALDRAQAYNTSENADFTNYTINRVGELSLNRKKYSGDVSSMEEKDKEHGCYFGIYNVVKLLGGLTSDVRFTDERVAGSAQPSDTYKTYHDWKQSNLGNNDANDGKSPNEIALASGVALDIVKDVKADGSKVYGPVTGIVQLDLLNVTPGEGGGYVYAENVHGARSVRKDSQGNDDELATVLSEANRNATVRTNKAYTYATGNEGEMLTSGNFVSTKHIVDDCFPTSKAYTGASKAPAHYWYIRGEFYIYEQEVSAYTGTAEAYSAQINIPLTMVAQSNAKIQLLNVLPGLYADPESEKLKSVTDTLEIDFQSGLRRFGQNDPISYWDWYNASSETKKLFTTETYICREQVTIDGTTYVAGQGIRAERYRGFEGKTGTDIDGKSVSAQSMFNPTNGVSKDNGFLLTLDMSNPNRWNDYFVIQNPKNKDVENRNLKSPLTTKEYQALGDGDKYDNTKVDSFYVKGATFKCLLDGIYGQYTFTEGDLTSERIYGMQDAEHVALSGQALFDEAYVVKEEFLDGAVSYQKGRAVAEESSIYQDYPSRFERAYYCVSTVNDGDLHCVVGQVIGEEEYQKYVARDLSNRFSLAYYCTQDGKWGGRKFEKDHNYDGAAYCQLSNEDREHFEYNFDALDLLRTNYKQSENSEFPSVDELARIGTRANPYVSLYDKDAATAPLYSAPVSIDYVARATNQIYHQEEGLAGFRMKTSDGNFKLIEENDKLDNEEFSKLPNDYAHYARIMINDNYQVDKSSREYKVYVVKETFDVGGVMYNAGKTFTKDNFESLGIDASQFVDELTLTDSDFNTHSDSEEFYYCLEPYVIGENDQYVEGYTTPSLVTLRHGTLEKGKTVEAGTIVKPENMSGLVNFQQGFEVSGDIPQEEASLYVPVQVDIADVQKDRYVTAIFQYSYTELDGNGIPSQTRVEKHIVNLRIIFKSGRPLIGKVAEPGIVLPLEKIDFTTPTIENTAFTIQGSGWEIYDNEADAKKNRNGRAYTPKSDPLYLYQDGHFVSYYAETSMGRTYSEAVPIHVANYQRMKDVINDPHHMYINHGDLGTVRPKIYIDTLTVGTADGKRYNELDAMQEMFTIVNGNFGTPGNDENYGRDIRRANGLEFFVQSDVTATRQWTPIGDDTNCFEGYFHGNGFTLSGLDHSLFGKLCGSVYNTGVTGPFPNGGIALTGDGHVENCWVSSTAATLTADAKAVFDQPGEEAKLLNCYYPKEQPFATHAAGVDVTARPLADFHNGSVAYDLNRNYLEARYAMFSRQWDNDGPLAKALFRMPDGTLERDAETDTVVVEKFHYADSIDHYYVEQLYADGDFRFADGLRPQNADLRWTDSGDYLPIYPDDYIFFGQRLNPGQLYSTRDNDTIPMGAQKEHTVDKGFGVVNNDQAGLLTSVLTRENRVYRAPAYHGNGTLGDRVYFNANAAFTADAHGKLTAIDFTGGNGDANDYQGVVAGAHDDFKGRADAETTVNYAPLTDFSHLDSLRVDGMSQNMLVYLPSMSAVDAVTIDMVQRRMPEPAYSETDASRRTVDELLTTNMVRGHVVQRVSPAGDYVSGTDHFLVDGQTYNAPIGYRFKGDHRMWHQRQPERFASHGGTGWEGISLPFTSEVVTTQDKGELTHFYQGDDQGKKGHEYWLRRLDGITPVTGSDDTLEGQFNAPAKADGSKTVYNHFLWDYYYQYDSGQDANTDSYQTYYRSDRNYVGYPYAAAAEPYLVGFPGSDYYEFDLSGQFEPDHTHSSIDKLAAQVVTFASAPNAAIQRSDDELASAAVEYGGYRLLPSYADTLLAAGAYVLNADGSSFEVTDKPVTVRAFRPYFVAASPSGGSAPRKTPIRRITFNSTSSSLGGDADEPQPSAVEGLSVFSQRHRVVVSSNLRASTDVRIFSTSGLCVASFTLAPGQTVETPVHSDGVYIVRAASGKYVQKLAVK